MTEYDKIAKSYDAARLRDFSRFVTYPFFRKLLGRIDGLDALDVGCGAGFSTRILKEIGARRVVGIDIAEKQIQLAREYEERLKQGIEYVTGDMTNSASMKLGVFDLASSVHGLQHNSNQDRLRQAIKNISRTLKLGSRFVGAISHPVNTVHGYNAYGVSYEFREGEGEGKPCFVRISDLEGREFCSFTEIYYSQRTYEEAFSRAGFKFEMMNPEVTQEGIKAKGREFWREFYRAPPIAFFVANKIKEPETK